MIKLNDSFILQEFLIKEGNLSLGAQKMIGDILNTSGMYYISLLEMLYVVSNINDNNE